jgi:hypothetical protein
MKCWDSTYATKSQDLHALNHETCTNMGSDHENARHLPSVQSVAILLKVQLFWG